MQGLPNLLNKIVEFLKKQDLNLSKNSPDGRINSALNEDEIINILSSKFIIERPDTRDWYDFSFKQNDNFYPVNIKISTTKTADNLNCKLGIYYALTGELPDFNNGVNWETYFATLSKNIKENSKDYYFLIINKDNTKDIFATSLKCLTNLVANGNNLPFQVKWDDNRTLINRSFNEAKSFILRNLGESLKLRADAYFLFTKYFNEKL